MLLVGVQSDTVGALAAATTLTPAGVQAGAAVASFLVTAVLALLTWRYVRFTREIADATRQQVLAVVAAGRSRQRAVAAALLKEVDRIRAELGPRPKDGELPLVVASGTGGVPPDRAVIRTDAVAPQVHEWFRPVIPQSAESDPAIVGLFLELDRDLHNYGGYLQLLRSAQADQTEKEATLKTYERTYEETGTAMSEVMEWREAAVAVPVAKANLEGATHLAVVTHKGCHSTLDALERALMAVW